MASVDWNAQITQYLNLGVESLPTPTTPPSRGTLLAALGSACQSAVERRIGRTFDVQTYTEIRDGNGRNALFLNWDPIVSVTSLTIDGSAVVVGNPQLPPTWPLARVIASPTLDALRFTGGGCFSCGIGNVVIGYSAGLANPNVGAPPDELVFAVVYAASMLFRDRDRIGLSTVTVQEQVTSFFRKLPDEVALMLTQWRRPWKPTW